MPFTKEYLKEYRKKIRKLPLEELYDILSLIRDHPFKADDTPERVRIVEKRIEELENSPDIIDPVEELNEMLEDEFKKKPHLLSFILKSFGYILLIPGIILVLLQTSPYINEGVLLIGISMILFMYAALIDKRITDKSAIFHREAHPFLYWSEIALLFITGVLEIFYGIRPFLQ